MIKANNIAEPNRCRLLSTQKRRMQCRFFAQSISNFDTIKAEEDPTPYIKYDMRSIRPEIQIQYLE